MKFLILLLTLQVLVSQARAQENSPESIPARALRSNSEDPQNRVEALVEVFDPEAHSERIPLRPPMSDRNWQKWAGPMLDKKYGIKRKDSLWVISQRLFGTPYVWPKLWQLNAQFGNPHLIDPGIVLRFQPGNLNSAPSLALKILGEESEYPLPVLIAQSPPLSLLEKVQYLFLSQQEGETPPLRIFFFEKSPQILRRLPRAPEEKGLYYALGVQGDINLPDGVYQIVSDSKSQGSEIIEWKGSVEVKDRRFTISRGFREINEGDGIIQYDFSLPMYSVRMEELDPDVAKRSQIILGVEGAQMIAGENQFLGVRFLSAEGGPSPGAIIPIFRGDREIAKAVLAHRQGRYGTLLIIYSEFGVSDRETLAPKN